MRGLDGGKGDTGGGGGEIDESKHRSTSTHTPYVRHLLVILFVRGCLFCGTHDRLLHSSCVVHFLLSFLSASLFLLPVK